MCLHWNVKLQLSINSQNSLYTNLSMAHYPPLIPNKHLCINVLCINVLALEKLKTFFHCTICTVFPVSDTIIEIRNGES